LEFSEALNSFGTGMPGKQVDGAAWEVLFAKTRKGLLHFPVPWIRKIRLIS
jgi:hypothetical protein